MEEGVYFVLGKHNHPNIRDLVENFGVYLILTESLCRVVNKSFWKNSTRKVLQTHILYPRKNIQATFSLLWIFHLREISEGLRRWEIYMEECVSPNSSVCYIKGRRIKLRVRLHFNLDYLHFLTRWGGFKYITYEGTSGRINRVDKLHFLAMLFPLSHVNMIVNTQLPVINISLMFQFNLSSRQYFIPHLSCYQSDSIFPTLEKLKKQPRSLNTRK